MMPSNICWVRKPLGMLENAHAIIIAFSYQQNPQTAFKSELSAAKHFCNLHISVWLPQLFRRAAHFSLTHESAASESRKWDFALLFTTADCDQINCCCCSAPAEWKILLIVSGPGEQARRESERQLKVVDHRSGGAVERRKAESERN